MSLSESAKSIEKEEEPSSGKQYSFIGLQGEALGLACSTLAGVGFLLFGYDQGVMGSLLTLDSFRETFPAIDTTKPGSNATLQGAVIALYEIGCMASALSTLYLGDKLGRLRLIFIGAAIMMVGGVLQSCAYTIAHLTVARIVTGVGNGFITSTVPVWQAEVAKPKMRGKLIMLQGSLVALGIAISYWVDFAFYFLDKPNASYRDVSFRFPIAFQCIFPIFILPVVLKFPESPRWLLKRGRNDDARAVFSALLGVPTDHPAVNLQVDEIVQSINKELEKGADKINLKNLLVQGDKKNFQRVMLAGWSQIMQQISGINLITYYAGTIFEQYIHMTPLNSRILAACNGTEYFLSSLVAFYTIERFGRRNLMMWGALGQSFTMAVLTGTVWAADPDNGNNTKAGVAAAVFLFVFNTFFANSWLGMSWLLPPELLPLEIRAPGSGISTACNWSFNFMVVMITPVAFQQIGAYTFTIFAAINLLMVPVVYLLYPETSGRTLEEMDVIFSQCPSLKPWKVVQIANELPMLSNVPPDAEQKPYGEHIENV